MPTTTDLTGWKKAATHPVVCPSGVTIEIRVPDLPALIEAGEIPQDLIEAALGAAGSGQRKPTVEAVIQQREFTDKLTQLTVTDPVLKDADLPEVPYEDKEFIVAIATRQRDLDAEGNHIGGLDTSEKFRRFRRLGEFESAVEGL